jgi:hypothetical protein
VLFCKERQRGGRKRQEWGEREKREREKIERRERERNGEPELLYFFIQLEGLDTKHPSSIKAKSKVMIKTISLQFIVPSIHKIYSQYYSQ